MAQVGAHIWDSLSYFILFSNVYLCVSVCATVCVERFKGQLYGTDFVPLPYT